MPPTDKEKYSYVRRHSWILTVCTVLTFPPLVYSQIRLFADSPWFLLYGPFMAIGTLTFFVSLLADGIGRGFDLAEHRKIVASWLPLWYPSVDVFLPTYGESIELLRNSWTHVAALRATYNGKLTPYVLDDGARPEVRRMARQFGFAYAVRPNRGWYKKSGNLKYGFEISNGDFILLLDADFAPRRDLLDETLPYFALFPEVGIVQTPQYFHVVDQQTWVERGAGAIQELFYRSIQATRARKEGAICVGSCAVYRRTALAQNDGMSLAEHSEDLHTGFDLYRLGWRLRYLPIALSTGNCPDNILAFLNQQYRWCSGTMSLMRDGKFWRTRLPMYSRLCYLAGLAGYAYTAVFTFIAPGPGDRDAPVRPRFPVVQEHDLRRAGAVLCRRYLPDVAPFAIPARGVVGPGAVRLGACLRAVGHAARQAARLAAVRHGREAPGRSPAAVGLLDRLELRQLGAVGDPRTVANDDDGRV